MKLFGRGKKRQKPEEKEDRVLKDRLAEGGKDSPSVQGKPKPAKAPSAQAEKSAGEETPAVGTATLEPIAFGEGGEDIDLADLQPNGGEEEESAEDEEEKKSVNEAKAPPETKKKAQKRTKKSKEVKEEEAGKSKKLLLLIPVMVLLSVAFLAGVLVTGKFSRGTEEPKQTGETDQTEKTDGTEDTEGAEGAATTGSVEGDGEAQASDQTVQQTMTASEAVDYLAHFSPQDIGLTGESMDSYDIFPSESVFPVNGMPCTRLSVYERNELAGTNDVSGIYLLGRGAQRQLFRLDPITGEVTEISTVGSVGTTAPEENSAVPKEDGGAPDGAATDEDETDEDKEINR